MSPAALAPDEYFAEAEKAPDATPYHRRLWIAPLLTAHRWLRFRPVRLAGGAALPLFDAGRRAVSIPFAEYGGPIGAPASAEALGAALPEGRPALVRANPHRPAPPGAPARTCTYLVDLSRSEEETWRGLRKTTRQSVEKAREGFRVRPAEGPADWRAFHRLHVESMRRNRAPAHRRAFFEALAREPGAHLLLALDASGKPASASLFLEGASTWLYSLSGTRGDALRGSPSALLLWEGLRLARAAGARTLDLGGTALGSPLATFKEGWRGEPVPLGPLAGGSGVPPSADSLARRAWGRLPLPLVEALSPWAWRMVGP